MTVQNDAVIKQIPMDVYRRDLGLAASDLKLLAYKTPLHFKAKIDGMIPSRESAALNLGTMVHMAVLEPEEFERVAVQEPAIDRRTKEYKAWKAELPKDALILSAEDDRIITQISENLQKSGLAKLWDGARKECSVFAEIDGIELKCRPDALNESLGLIIDLKTTRDLSWFASDARKLKYPFSVPHYQRICKAATRRGYQYIFVAVETEPPFDVSWFRLSLETLTRARADYDLAIDLYKTCTATGRWTGHLNEEVGLI